MAQDIPPTSVFTSFPPHAEVVTPSDSAEFNVPSTVYVGAAGVVRVIPARPKDGTTTVDFTVPAGGVVPCLVTKVYSTGTTATDLVRVY